MALHHRLEILDMRNAYEYDKRNPRNNSPDSVHDSAYGSGSTCSFDAPPTSYPVVPAARLPPVVHNEPYRSRDDDVQYRSISDGDRCATPTSIEEERRTQSTISFIGSEDDLDDIPEFNEPPSYTEDGYQPSAIPSRPEDFSALFPSHRRLDIRHDDSTDDGNMNLRVDTEVRIHGQKCSMTLFHLRMHDLRKREFSLRRYCRDSGREVCHSIRQHEKSSRTSRPSFQRSLSNALHSMRPKLEHRSSSGPATMSLARHDSGYGSMHSSDEEHRESRPTSSGSDMNASEPPFTNSIKVEFSNYAQMQVNLTKDKKRYEFNYWKYELAWKRIIDKATNEVSFHLIDRKQHSKKILAYIRQIPLTDCEIAEERQSGGWIPQCMMWIADEGLVEASKDVADAVVAAGLMALVDDSIRTHFHSAESKLLMIPTSKLQMGVDYVGPTRLINEMFGRKDSRLDNASRPSSRDH